MVDSTSTTSSQFNPGWVYSSFNLYSMHIWHSFPKARPTRPSDCFPPQCRPSVKATRHLTVSNLPVIVAGFKHHLLVRRLSHEHYNNISRDLGAGIGERLVHPVLADPELSGVVVKHGPTVFGLDLHFTEL
jgi:hypothetical protein